MSDLMAEDMAKYTDDEQWLLQRADGFMDLGMAKDARAELDKIPAAMRHTTVMRVSQLRLAFTERDWPRAAELAAGLCVTFPREPAFWVERAYATRRAVSIPAAHEILTDAALRFPKLATIRFNLACYDCQLGHLDAALLWLEQAVALDANYRAAALEDEDLKPLWDKIG